jgi:hypothetical protein
MVCSASTDAPIGSGPSRFLLPLAILFALLLSALNLWFGPLNQDEGWYLYAARLMAQGKLPFIDFASTQGPVMPFVYALLWAPLQGLGLVGGRLVTVALGWGAAGLAALLAARLAGADRATRRAAAFAAFTLIGVNVTHSYFTTIVKTYALGGLLLTGGFLALQNGTTASRRRPGWTALAGLLFALGAGCRASLVMTLPVVFLWLAHRRYRNRCAVCPWTFAIAAALTMLALFGPFLLAAPQALWFGMVDYHAGRETGSLAAALAYKAAFILRTAHAYFVAMALLLVTWFARGLAPKPDAASIRPPLRVPLACAVILISLLHFMAPFPYDDYQAIVFPLLAVLVAVGLAPLLQRAALRWLLLLLCLMASFSSPRCQEWFAAPRDRIWWPMRSQSALAQLRATAATLREAAGPDRLLLTQDTYLAVEAGLDLPAGMEMGPFCYYPDWTRAQAETCHVLNRDMLTELLATTPASQAAFSAYGLSIASPAVQPIPPDETRRLQALLESRYALTATIPAFGQAQTTLKLYQQQAAPVLLP